MLFGRCFVILEVLFHVRLKITSIFYGCQKIIFLYMVNFGYLVLVQNYGVSEDILSFDSKCVPLMFLSRSPQKLAAEILTNQMDFCKGLENFHNNFTLIYEVLVFLFNVNFIKKIQNFFRSKGSSGHVEFLIDNTSQKFFAQSLKRLWISEIFRTFFFSHNVPQGTWKSVLRKTVFVWNRVLWGKSEPPRTLRCLCFPCSFQQLHFWAVSDPTKTSRRCCTYCLKFFTLSRTFEVSLKVALFCAKDLLFNE